jgi:hypothetical protein
MVLRDCRHSGGIPGTYRFQIGGSSQDLPLVEEVPLQ